MKKIFILLLVFSILLVSSCATRITYTEEFPFLPAYKNMTLEVDEEDLEEDTAEEPGQLVKKTFIVANADVDNILGEYEQILNEDGWTITYDGKPQMLEAEKGEHKAMFVAYGQDGDVKLDITAK